MLPTEGNDIHFSYLFPDCIQAEGGPTIPLSRAAEVALWNAKR
jgi:hypothetical protein